MKIGNLEFNNIAFLAPMAGMTDRAFREICMSFGAGLCATEMISAKALSLGDKKSRFLMTMGSEHPCAIQLFGNDPAIMAEGASIAMGYKPEIIDINMGCPAPKIAMSGSGSAILKTPKLAGQITEAVVKSSDVPVTVKIRKGWDSENIQGLETALECEKAGASAIIVHGRTREEMYSGKVDYDFIKKVKDNVSIPVIGNGDIVDAQSAAIMLEKTNCDAIMIGRGALGNPWLFRSINAYLSETRYIPEPSVEEKMLLMLKHIQRMIEYKGEHTGMLEARHHAGFYTKGMRGSAAYRREMNSLNSYEELVELTARIVKEQTQ